MNQTRITRIAPAAILAGVLASLAMTAPSYNAQHFAPRSVFLTLPETTPDPVIALSANQEKSQRWTLRIDVSSFQFTDLCVAEAEAVPIGHGHVVRNGVKILSAYQPIADLGRLPPGRHHISVTLRGQDHRAILGNKGLIQQDIIIDVPILYAIETRR